MLVRVLSPFADSKRPPLEGGRSSPSGARKNFGRGARLRWCSALPETGRARASRPTGIEGEVEGDAHAPRNRQTETANAGRHRRGGTGRPAAGAPARPPRHRLDHRRGSEPRLCRGRVRAGVLEQGTVDTLTEVGVGERMMREGLVHNGIEIRFDRQRHRIDFPSLTGGKRIMVYGQGEVVKDLIDARLDAGDPIHFEVEATSVHDFDGDAPTIRYRKDGDEHEIACDFIAGCDGFHGICRPSFPRARSSSTSGSIPMPGSASCRNRRRRRRSVVLPQRARLRASVARSPTTQPALRPGRSRRGHRQLAGRTVLGGACSCGRRPRTATTISRSAGRPEGHHADAELRRRADAVRPTVPRRRRRPHRAADRRQGHESRGRRHPLSGRGRSRRSTGPATPRCSTATRRAACAASGRPSVSRGG